MGSTPAVRADALTKIYPGGVRGLCEATFSVAPGEVFGYLGPNGAGKTTTLRMILDLIRPTSGRLEVLGLDPRRDGVSLRRRVGYLPGDVCLEGRLTARELFTYFGNLRGGVDARVVERLAERFELDVDRPIGELSGGNRQKVALVQAFMHRPDLLVLDEPTSGLDPLMQREFERLVRETAAEGRTVLLSSHVLAEVQRMADRVGIVRRGRVIATEEVAALRARPLRRIEIRTSPPLAPDALRGVPGVRKLAPRNGALHLEMEGRLDPLLRALERVEVLDLLSHEPDLEEVFLAYYEEPE